jgi:hypothetical protein
MNCMGPTGYESHSRYNSEQKRVNQNQVFLSRILGSSSDWFLKVPVLSRHFGKIRPFSCKTFRAALSDGDSIPNSMHCFVDYRQVCA